jgi:hypothetical protein
MAVLTTNLALSRDFVSKVEFHSLRKAIFTVVQFSKISLVDNSSSKARLTSS